MIDHGHRAIFVHIPKTAGLSVKLSFLDRAEFPRHRDETFQEDVKQLEIEHDVEQLTRHATVEMLTREYPRQVAEYFKFAFVRNPWDRLVSTFFFLSRGGVGNRQDRRFQELFFAKYEMDFARFVHGELARHRFSRSRATGQSGPDAHSLPQLCHVLHLWPQHWYTHHPDGRPFVDFLGRFERLQADFGQVCRRLGIRSSGLALTNRSEHRPFDDYYDAETRRIVADVYATDIELFEYAADRV